MSQKVNELSGSEKDESSGYGPRFLLGQLSGHTNKLRGRLYNLVDSIANDERQNAAMKGLVKDFTSKFYWDMHEWIVQYLSYKKILDPNQAGSYVGLDDTPPIFETPNLREN